MSLVTSNGVIKSDNESEWDENEEWEWETESDEEDEAPLPTKNQPSKTIQIDGSLLKIERAGSVDWSEDEYEESSVLHSKVPVPPPPPPPSSKDVGNVPAPPPPPPSPPKRPTNKNRQQILENLKKRAPNRPNWNDLMVEIEVFRNGHSGLNKVISNDRSKPILPGSKIGNQFVYESEKDSKNADILKDIRKGIKLKRVRTNDRSRPNLRGIRNFRRQTTKEERPKDEGPSLDEEIHQEYEDDENVNDLRDDLESTKQLLALEVRSKQLLEKDNKRLQMEMERLRSEFTKMTSSGETETTSASTDNSHPASRRSSMQMKRQSMIRLLSENDNIPENDEDESLKQEAEEARQLAEEWEFKYKEMQRQMADVESGRLEKKSTMMLLNGNRSHGSEEQRQENESDEAWMLKREVQELKAKLRNMSDKREVIIRERNLLNERIETLVNSISAEVDARKKLKREVNDMNEAFKNEIAEMCAEEKTKAELEDCYYSDEENLVVSENARRSGSEEDGDDSEEEDEEDEDDEDVEGTIDDILHLAENEEEDENAYLFQEPEEDENSLDDGNPETTIPKLNCLIDDRTSTLHAMRKSNFDLKSKIDRLYDILQMQKEKHHDLKQELTRMLADIQ